MSRQGFPARRTAFGGVVLSLFASGLVFAQEGEGESPEAAASELEAAPTSEPAAAEAAAAPLDEARSTTLSAVGVEHLLGSAFPAPQLRGIEGGSLSMTLHGLQWPYMPALAGEPSTRIGFSGSAWVDTSYRSVDSSLANDPDLKEWQQQARLVLRATPTYNAPGDWFLQAQGEIALVNATPSSDSLDLVADDLYVRIGRWNSFDVTAGRFQAWEVYHLGMGLDQNTVERTGASTQNNAALDLNRDVQFLWERANGPGNVALHAYPTDYLRFELLGRVGSTGQNNLGLRPAGILDLGVVKAKLAAEYLRAAPAAQGAAYKDRTINRGIVGALQAVLAPVLEAGGTAAYALTDNYNSQGVLEAGRSYTTYSFGGFANVRVLDPLLLGAGGTYTHQHNLKVDVTGTLNDIKTHLQVFGAAQYTIWDQLHIKAVVAYANALFDPQSDPPPVATFRNKSLSGRIRLLYAF